MQKTKTLAITTLAPLSVIVTNNGPYYVSENTSISVGWTPFLNPATLIINWGDITETKSVLTPGTFIHKYSLPNTYTISVTVTDNGNGATGVGSTTMQVAADLAINFTVDKATGNIPLAVNFTATATGGFSTYSYSLDFGDGSIKPASSGWNGSAIAVPHTYLNAGTYAAILTVTDALGASLSAEITISQTNLAILGILGFAGLVLLVTKKWQPKLGL